MLDLHEGDRTLRLTVSYVGTPFAGWQRQRRGDTVQGLLESALARVLQRETAVVGAGRTDAGVHARAQVAHCRLPARTDAGALLISLNSLLPKEIRVERLSRARPGFHARRDARGKHYRYRLLAVRKASPFDAPFVGRLPGPAPDAGAMVGAARRLLGRHDFAAFCGRGSAVRDTRRRITRLDIRRRGDIIVFDVEGDGFLKHQIRNMVGTLVEVGQGRRTAASLSGLLQGGDRRLAGPTAPAAGLVLMRVRYGGPEAGPGGNA